jgi:O-antigen/teichoic acid export membrane protein
MLAQKVSKGVLSIGTWTVTKVFVSSLATPFIARYLGTEGYGAYSYVMALLLLVAPMANAGTMQTLWKYVAEVPDQGRRSRIAAQCVLLNSVGVVLVGIIMFFVLSHDPPDSPFWLVGFIVVAAMAVEQIWWYARGILFGMQREELAGIPGAIGAIIGSVISVVLAVAGCGVSGVLFGYLAGNLFLAIVPTLSARTLIKRSTFKEGVASGDPQLKSLFRFSMMTMAFAVLGMVLFKTSMVLLYHLTGNNAMAGIFAAGVQMGETSWVLVIPVEAVMIQTTAHFWVEGNIAEVDKVAGRMSRYVGLAVGVALTTIFVLADDLIVIYFGPRFAASATILRVVIPGVFGYCLARVLGSVIHARGLVTSLVVTIASASVLCLVLSFVLIPSMGAVGAAIATTVSYGVVVIPYAFILRSHGVHPFRSFQWERQLLLFALVGTAVFAATHFVPTPVLRSAVGLLVAVPVGGAGCLRLHLITSPEALKIARSLPANIGKIAGNIVERLMPVLQFLEGGGSIHEN